MTSWQKWVLTKSSLSKKSSNLCILRLRTSCEIITNSSIFLKEQAGKYVEDRHPVPRDVSDAINAAYSEGKSKRDALRFWQLKVGSSTKHSTVKNYCDAIGGIFNSVLNINEGFMSAGRQMIDLSDVFCDPKSRLTYEIYNRIVQLQVKYNEDRWTAACQMYAVLLYLRSRPRVHNSNISQLER
jgi:hypothetical protein